LYGDENGIQSVEMQRLQRHYPGNTHDSAVGWQVVMNPKPNSGRKSQGRTNKMPWNSVQGCSKTAQHKKMEHSQNTGVI